MADRIRIDSLELASYIGVPADERRTTQRLTVSLVLEPVRDFSALEDRIENTVDYFSVCQFVKALSLSGPRQLIETLAQEIAERLLVRYPLRAVEVELRKYILPDTEYVAVQLRRERAEG